MPSQPTPRERFDRWFVQPIAKLKELPSGDGAFAALMIALPLYDRYIHAKLKLAGIKTKEKIVQQEMAVDLNLEVWQQSIFWDIFRNGFMHEAMGSAGNTKWMIDKSFSDLPVFVEIEGINCIQLNPWKFAARIIAKYNEDDRLITATESYPLASIFSILGDGI